MKTKIIKTVVIELTESEAVWLKYIMQNPRNDIPLDKEPVIDKKNRESLFSVLTYVIN